MYKHYHIASRLAERLKGRTGLSALAFAVCIKMFHTSSVLFTNGNADSAIARKMHCSMKTANKVLCSALKLGLVSYDKNGNIVAGRLYNIKSLVECVKTGKYGNKSMVNVLTIDSKEINIQSVRKQIEDAMMIKSVEYAVRKENARNSSTIAKDQNSMNVRTARELTLKRIADRIGMTPQNICRRMRELAKKGLISIKRIPACILCNVNLFDGKKNDVFVSGSLVVSSQHNEYAIVSVDAYRMARNRIFNYFTNVRKQVVGGNVVKVVESVDLTVPMSDRAYSRMGYINSIYD